MREIEFRGQECLTKSWIYGSLINRRCKRPVIQDKDAADTFTEYSVIPETIGQYTGLKDKNGVKIFEGDIVAYKTMNLPVRWDDEKAGFFIGNDKYWMMNDPDLKVISNIHDNPELLEVNNEKRN